MHATSNYMIGSQSRGAGLGQPLLPPSKPVLPRSQIMRTASGQSLQSFKAPVTPAAQSSQALPRKQHSQNYDATNDIHFSGGSSGLPGRFSLQPPSGYLQPSPSRVATTSASASSGAQGIIRSPMKQNNPLTSPMPTSPRALSPTFAKPAQGSSPTSSMAAPATTALRTPGQLSLTSPNLPLRTAPLLSMPQSFGENLDYSEGVEVIFPRGNSYGHEGLAAQALAKGAGAAAKAIVEAEGDCAVFVDVCAPVAQPMSDAVAVPDQIAEPQLLSTCGELSGDDEEVDSEKTDILQFCAPTMYMKEDEEKCTVSVMRIGQLRGAVSCDWHTEDSTAKEGVKYRGGSGTLHFADGEDHAELDVHILNDENWGTSTQFKIVLTNEVGCKLGKYLFQSYVCIIDDDAFPSNRYEPEVLRDERELEKIPSYLLMYDFLKHCVQCVPGVGRRTLLILIFDQLHNLNYLLRTYLISIYMVDVVFAKEPEGTLWAGTQKRTALLVAFLLGAPVVVLHFWDHCKAEMDLAGDLRTYFQKCLFTKYIHYKEGERIKISTAEIQGALRVECKEIVEAGFMKCFSVFSLIGKLLIVSAFVLHENPMAISVVMLYPILTLIWLWFRIGKLITVVEDVVNSENGVFNKIQVACERFRVIADYGHQPEVCAEIGEKVESLNQQLLKLEMTELTNLKFTSWLSTCLTVGYVAIFSQHVLDGFLSLGTFLAMVKVFSELGEEFEEALTELMELSSAVGPLFKVVRLMNGEENLLDCIRQSRHNLKQTHHKRNVHTTRPKLENGTVKQVIDTADLIDNLPFVIEQGTEFSFAANEDEEEEDYTGEASQKLQRQNSNYSVPRENSNSDQSNDFLMIRRDEDLEVPQGKMVSVVGSHGSGKATLLNLFSGVLYANKGSFHIPSHLRLLHVSHTPMLIEKGLWRNLIYGAIKPKPKRVMKILQDIEHDSGTLSKQLEEELKEGNEELRDGDGKAWRTSLSYTEHALVHITRALVMNPEVMVLHRPLVHFDDATQVLIFELIQKHVADRGLEMGDHKKTFRRPRSVIFSSDFKWASDAADVKVVLTREDTGDDGQKISTISMIDSPSRMGSPAPGPSSRPSSRTGFSY